MEALFKKAPTTELCNEEATSKLVKYDKNSANQIATIEETLSRFGLLINEIKVYIYLARAGEKKAGEIAEAIALHRTETYRILRDLEKKGILFSVFEKPLRFTAVPLDKVIDLLVNVQKMKIRQLEKEKESLVKMWMSLPQQKTEPTAKGLFQPLQGEQVMLKATELFRNTNREFQIFIPDSYISQIYYSDFTEVLREKRGTIETTLLTEDSAKAAFFTKHMKWSAQKCQTVNTENLPCFMISDKREVLIAFHENNTQTETGDKKKDKTSAIWTNYTAFVSTLQLLFLKLQENGSE